MGQSTIVLVLGISASLAISHQHAKHSSHTILVRSVIQADLPASSSSSSSSSCFSSPLFEIVLRAYPVQRELSNLIRMPFMVIRYPHNPRNFFSRAGSCLVRKL